MTNFIILNFEISKFKMNLLNDNKNKLKILFEQMIFV